MDEDWLNFYSIHDRLGYAFSHCSTLLGGATIHSTWQDCGRLTTTQRVTTPSSATRRRGCRLLRSPEAKKY